MQKNSRKFWIGALAAAQFLGASIASAGIIVASDDFSDSAASLAAWTAETNATHSVANDSAGLGSGNALFVGVAGTSLNRTTFGFSEVNLTQAGDWIQVNLDFRLNGTFVQERFVPLFGLFQDIDEDGHINIADNVGYVATLTTSPRPTGTRPNTEGLGRDSEATNGIFAGVDIYNLYEAQNTQHVATGQNYTLQLRITRNELGQAEIDFVLGGAGNFTMSVTDTGANPVMSFSAFGIRSRMNDFVIDNFEVTAIPEPSSLLLMGLVGGSLGVGLLGFRRRKRPTA